MMKRIRDPVLNFLRSEDGPTAVEYAVLLALIVAICALAISNLGASAQATFKMVEIVTSPGSNP